ncbi:hypothetical protein C4K88_16500 [Arthrobacter pityocampae]|uniref:RelA/SpoT domain-containing protein n=1 Tax=Arthrobacter pityocampae TaxID=547334 RepID=A0A2S5IU17_9MICC|nr:hypothetical protein [Arthrobacter pityocampae]PPB48049.1 hypothetical protein C4K88_16500 [Arthrobacter pityocampae]
MSIIDDFVNEYERQFDYWEAAARIVQRLLEAELASSGLRAIVTSRAKSVDRLAEKLRKRNQEKHYRSTADIKKDIADLAGVRVALYFPGQMDEVERLIHVTLQVMKINRFPVPKEQSHTKHGKVDFDGGGGSGKEDDGTQTHRQRFSGYGATHYRVHVPGTHLAAEQKRYASALVEVQVASVLMHAWSEVEHDLVYKPQEGALSRSEYALLDQLNGLVLAGEIALEQLQQAGDARVTGGDTQFRDHYELAEFLRTRLLARGIGLTDATLGRVDVLFDFLAEQTSATASSVETYLDQLKRDFEVRPVAAQLADLMLSGNESRYQSYLRAMSASRHPSKRGRPETTGANASTPETLVLGEFITYWVILEGMLKQPNGIDNEKSRPLGVIFQELRKKEKISQEQFLKLLSLRDLRNRVLHGRAEEVPSKELKVAAAWLRDFTNNLKL